MWKPWLWWLRSKLSLEKLLPKGEIHRLLLNTHSPYLGWSIAVGQEFNITMSISILSFLFFCAFWIYATLFEATQHLEGITTFRLVILVCLMLNINLHPPLSFQVMTLAWIRTSASLHGILEDKYCTSFPDVLLALREHQQLLPVLTTSSFSSTIFFLLSLL